MEKAFAARKAHFPDEIKFFAPGLKRYAIPEFEQQNPLAFLPISLTGAGCALDCDHCNKKILEPMIPLDPKEGLFAMCEKMARKGTESILISGGSKSTGEVPFMKHIDDIRRVKEEAGHAHRHAHGTGEQGKRSRSPEIGRRRRRGHRHHRRRRDHP
ncbi:MAG: hypothetical protein IPG32_17690 [Saprospirales bacterium]|nr:hypothetical protein [Saprospirales bacterium]